MNARLILLYFLRSTEGLRLTQAPFALRNRDAAGSLAGNAIDKAVRMAGGTLRGMHDAGKWLVRGAKKIAMNLKSRRAEKRGCIDCDAVQPPAAVQV
jgi:hypothetical protein